MSPDPRVKSNPMDTITHLSRESFKDDEMGRLVALNEARALVQRLETPWEALVREVWLSVSYGKADTSISHKHKRLTRREVIAFNFSGHQNQPGFGCA